MRPDYCPVGNEPCQSLCDEPCSTTPKRKPLTEYEIDCIRFGITAAHHTEHAIKLTRAIEAAHGITGEHNGNV